VSHRTCTVALLVGAGCHGECPEPSDNEAWYGALDPGIVTTDGYEHDAGLASIAAQIDDEQWVTWDYAADHETALSIDVAGARVSSVVRGYTQGDASLVDAFFIADARAAVLVSLPPDTATGQRRGLPDLRPGDTVDFRATGGMLAPTGFQNDAAIVTALEDFVVSSHDDPVRVWSIEALESEYHPFGLNVRAWGRVLGTSTRCPYNSWCRVLEYRGSYVAVEHPDPDLPALRTGKCVEVAAPVTFTAYSISDVVDTAEVPAEAHEANRPGVSLAGHDDWFREYR
jgi:hypothetical protein